MKRLLACLPALAMIACSESPTTPIDDARFARDKCDPWPACNDGGKPDGGKSNVYSIDVTIDPAQVLVGGEALASVVARDRKGNVIPDVSVTWSSGEPAVATVESQTGIVTGVSPGVATITASTDGKKPKTGSADVTVVAAPPYALDFDNSWVTVPDHNELDLTTTWTLEAWIKPDNAANGYFQHVISKWNGGSNASYTLEIGRTGKLRSGVHDGIEVTQWFESNATLVSNVWQHVAITLEGGIRRLYINGVADNFLTNSQIPMNSDRPVSFGREGEPYGGWRYAGLIDEVRIWNVARSATEIADNMASPLTGSEAGLVGYWRFDEGSGNVAFDATGSGHDGQLGGDTNNPAWTTDAAPMRP